MSRDFKLYIDDMCLSAEKILRYTHGFSFDQFIKFYSLGSFYREVLLLREVEFNAR